MKKILIAFLASLAFSFSAFAAVNLNTATQAEIESLEGIGPVKAAAIIDYRKKNGGFKSVDELEKVDGIGPATLANVRKNVSVSGKTTVAVPADVKPTSKADKPAKTEKETKSVGNEKAAASGKTADSKEVKAEKAKKEAPAKEKANTKKTKADEKKAAEKK